MAVRLSKVEEISLKKYGTLLGSIPSLGLHLIFNFKIMYVKDWYLYIQEVWETFDWNLFFKKEYKKYLISKEWLFVEVE